MARKNENSQEDKVLEKENSINDETLKSLQDIIKNLQLEISELKKNKPEVEKYTGSQYIDVKSVTQGSLSYFDTRTGMRWEWNEYGAIQRMTTNEIIAMHASYPDYLTTPLVVIEDEEILRKLNIDKFYNNKNFEVSKNLNNFFNLSFNEMKDCIDEIGEDVKDNIKVLALEKYKNKEITDLNLIKFLKENLNLDLSLFED